MQPFMELTELLFVIIPLVVVGKIARRPAVSMPQWTFQVVTTAASALFSMGIALTRLTASCLPNDPCAQGLVAISRAPGIFKSCQVCAHNNAPGFFSLLNSWLIELQCVSAALCLLGSMGTLARFVIWTRKKFNSQN